MRRRGLEEARRMSPGSPRDSHWLSRIDQRHGDEERGHHRDTFSTFVSCWAHMSSRENEDSVTLMYLCYLGLVIEPLGSAGTLRVRTLYQSYTGRIAYATPGSAVQGSVSLCQNVS